MNTAELSRAAVHIVDSPSWVRKRVRRRLAMLPGHVKLVAVQGEASGLTGDGGGGVAVVTAGAVTGADPPPISKKRGSDGSDEPSGAARLHAEDAEAGSSWTSNSRASTQM